MTLHKISRFFELDCYAFPVKVSILNQLQLQRSPYQKIKGLLMVLEGLQACQISHASHFSYFKQKAHQLPPTTAEIHQLLPYIFKRQPQQKAHQLGLQFQAALVQINEGLYFRSPRLATRFESNAAHIDASSYLAAVEQGQLTVCKCSIIASGVTARGQRGKFPP